MGSAEQEVTSQDSVIIIAEDLAPSETIQLDKSKVKAFVTRLGSMNSHTAILARTMNIPALIGVEIDAAWDGLMGAGKRVRDQGWQEDQSVCQYRKYWGCRGCINE